MPQQKKLIVAIHGAGMHAGVWGSLTGALAHTCQAISLPGHGKAEGDLLPSIEKMGAWMKARLEGHPPRSVVLMGHSMGALVALEAATAPAVSALVLMGAAAKMPVHPELLHQAAENVEAATAMILKWGVSPVHPQSFAIRTVLKEQMQPTRPETLLNDLKACHAYQGGEAAARKISRPALVLSGLDDKLTKSDDGSRLAGMMGQGQFHVVADGGHMLMVEKPVETAKEIDAFIDGLEG